MKIVKVLLVAGMALYLTLTVIDNVTMPQPGFGAVQAAVGMETTFKHPGAMWRAITNPLLIWVIFALIVFMEAVAATLCWIGAARLWAARGEARRFDDAKGTALLGLGITAAFYFIVFLVIGNEWFLMWQSQPMSLPLTISFRDFAAAILIVLFLDMPDA